MSQPTRRLYISDGPVSVVAPRVGPVHLKVFGRAGVLLETEMRGVRGIELTNSAPVSGQPVVEIREKKKPAPVAKPAVPKPPAKVAPSGPTVVKSRIEVTLSKPGEAGYKSWHDSQALVVGKNGGFPKGRFVVRVNANEIYENVQVAGSYLSSFSSFFRARPHLQGGEKLVFTKVADVTVKEDGKNVTRPCYNLKVVGAKSAPVVTQNQVSIFLPPAQRAKKPSWGAHYGVLVVPASVKPFFPKPRADFVILDGHKRHVVRIPDGYISGLTQFFKDHKDLKVGDELVFKKESDVTVKQDIYPCYSVKVVKH